jgi:hypothetical protein
MDPCMHVERSISGRCTRIWVFLEYFSIRNDVRILPPGFTERFCLDENKKNKPHSRLHCLPSENPTNFHLGLEFFGLEPFGLELKVERKRRGHVLSKNY